jgi:cell division transport system permease protein
MAMVLQEEKHTKRQLTSSYFTSVISITLVLFMLGLLGLIVLHAHKLSEYIKENIGFEIIMQEDVREAGIIQLQKTLDATPAVKSTEYISQQEATNRLTQDLGEDFIKWLGEDENPLLPSIDVRFKAAWANNDSLTKIESQLLAYPGVKEVFYQKSLVHLINQNLRRIGIVLSGFSLLLLIISIALINNTIRLSIYSKRFLIKSMQLVGATAGFIRRPFVWSGILQGIIGALVALLLLATVLYTTLQNIPELVILQDFTLVLIVFAIVLVLGIAIAGISTHISIGKYLNAKTDKLFA